MAAAGSLVVVVGKVVRAVSKEAGVVGVVAMVGKSAATAPLVVLAVQKGAVCMAVQKHQSQSRRSWGRSR